ncbi:IgaA/UmoB family intracellular growth attenuator [Gilliamella sp. Pas-s95]|uniref:IgaA/UmoB family intracellular growth attenuator n=1 Tax=Gilliamella sp. Pas-s95 TaxID=2687317 RepID=UPI0013221565|nr:IgaA/UmoB family intracellular growth attenuator [Gilliamella sp. Pas-s95]MWN05824.1 hypothetical protein [Gilliamella sp. Pas-s95]
MEFYWLIKIFLIGLAIFSWINYSSKRHTNNRNLKDVIKDRISIRKLTENEFELLEPYLNNKWLVFPYKYQSSLIDLEVSKIEGNCVRYSLYTNTEETSFYYEIDGIELFFPYNMYLHISDFNVAEVVFTEKYAFVVKINDYDLKTAAESQGGIICSELDEPWMYEQSFDSKMPEDEQTSNDTVVSVKPNPDKKIDFVKLLEREETPLELRNRNKKGNGLLSAIFLTLMTVFFLIYWYSNNSTILILVIFSTILSVIFYWYQPRSKYDLNNVICIKGLIKNKNVSKKEVIIGEDYILNIPHHWLPFLPDKSSLPANMDISVSDRKLIRYENTLSINQEIEQFGAPKFAKHNLILLITGTILSAVVYFQTSLVDNAMLAYQFFNDNITARNLQDESTLKNSPIQKGDLVNIKISGASCDVNEKKNENRCHTLFINNQPIDIETNYIVSIAEPIKNLFKDNFINTRVDQDVIAAQQYQDRLIELYKSFDRITSQYQRYIKESFTKLIDIGKIVITVDKVCKVSEIDCLSVKKELTALFDIQFSDDLSDWEKFVNESEINPNHDEIVSVRNVSKLDNSISRLKADVIARLKSTVSDYQHDKSSFRVDLSENSYLEMGKLEHINNDKSGPVSLLTVEHYYDVLFAKAGNIDIVGRVSDIYYRDDNSISGLKIKANSHYSTNLDELFSFVSPIFVSLAVFMITALVSILNSVVICYKLLANHRRKNKILAIYKNRII